MRRKSYISLILGLLLIVTILGAQVEIGTAESKMNEVFQDSGPPIVTLEPEDFFYEEGTTGNYLYWEFSDENMAVIDLYLDGVMVYTDVMLDDPTHLNFNVTDWQLNFHLHPLEPVFGQKKRPADGPLMF